MYFCTVKKRTMKRILYLSTILIVVIMISCSKSSSAPEDNTSGDFKFISLVPQDTAIQVNGFTNVTANATGSGLTYKWTASYGTFLGSGSTVKWTVCHSDKFTITCEVKDDKGHSDSKSVSINVH